MGLQRDKAFGARTWVTHGCAITGLLSLVTRFGLVLAARNVMWKNRIKRPNNLELFITNGIRIEPCRRFHCDETQQLHQVILHHIAHRARFVIVFAPAPNAYGFGHGDLDVIDILAVPERLEQHVAKANRHQVLHGLFTQVVIDPVNLTFVKIFGERCIQGFGGLQIPAKRFFNDDTALGVRHAPLLQPFCKIAKQRRRHRKIIRLYTIRTGHKLL